MRNMAKKNNIQEDLKLEQAVLAALLIEPDAFIKVSKDLISDLFYHAQNKAILEAIIDINDNSGEVDILTVSRWLKNNGLIEIAGGVSYIAEITTNIGSAAHIENHILILKQLYFKRFILKEAVELQEIASQSKSDPFTIIEDFEIKLSKLNDDLIVRDFQTTEQLLKEIEEKNNFILNNSGELIGVPTFFSELDKCTGGFQGGQLIILAARPGMGKTAIALNMAIRQSEKKISVGFFSLEMTSTDLFRRGLSQLTEIPLHHFTRTGYSGGMKQHIKEMTDKINALPLKFDDTGGISFFQLKQKIRRLVKQHKCKIIYIDYLQLITIQLKGGNREQEVATITKGLKALAKELNVPIIVLAQLSRVVETTKMKIPDLSHLRESGSIEQDADIVLFPWRPEYYDILEYESLNMQGKAILFLKKHRNGSLEDILLNFKGETTTFTDYIQYEQQF